MIKKPKPEKRFYRKLIRKKEFLSFELVAGESDIWVSVPKKEVTDLKFLKEILTDYLISLRSQILSYSERFPKFLKSLKPLRVDLLAPSIVKEMAVASAKVGVGPMAGVAGAVNKFLGKRLKSLGISQFIVENGGDVFISSSEPIVSAILTGNPNIDGKLGIEIPPGEWGLCSSSSKIGHSLSLGYTQIATVLSTDPILSDCVATFLGNSKTEEEFVKRCRSISDIEGTIGLVNGKFVVFGNLKLVKLS
ncbi:UPF0280 family protein [Desulfurobacterium thermolithotrophum]|uniref:UPF0280 family protein n=1 Tax=Desulfurobacterium thermolithotrophum TaxID=64160 RepID=UPI0013D2D593|nr:UPF0280 family protein [Desulfurobacterium thermolithotrophum]